MPNLATHIGDILASAFMSLMGYAGIQLSGDMAHSVMSVVATIGSLFMITIGIAIFLVSIFGIAREE